MNYLYMLLCVGILGSLVLLSIVLYRLNGNNSNNKPVTIAQMDAGGQCVETQGFNPFGAECCKGLTAFGGPGGNYCLQKGNPNCKMMCQMEVCEQGEGGLDQTCYNNCIKLC